MPNLIYSPHFYTGTLVPPKFTGDRSRLNAEMALRQREADQLSAALWVGELGDDHNAPYGPEWADAVLDSADDLGAGWAWWQWRQDDDNWRIRSLDGKSYDTRFLPHVARPYVAAAPRGTHGGRGDGIRGRLTITVEAGHADQPVEVSWPTMTLSFPTASGGCLAGSSWDPGRSRLTLDLSLGAGCDIEVRT